MKKVALLFPGQGAQSVGMCSDFYAGHFPSAKAVFERADEVLGYSLKKLIFEGPEEKLRETLYTQPAVFTASAAALEAFRAASAAAGISVETPSAAGHSLGEYTALYSAGVFDFAAGLTLVKKRAELIQAASEATPGAMAAVMGLAADKLSDICAVSGAEAVNFNSPGQTVIAGTVSAVEKAMALAREAGALKVIGLNVSGAFHSSLMKSAALGMSEALKSSRLCAASFPVITNCDALPATAASDIAAKLVTQIDHPVLWEKSARFMLASGVDVFVEIGPGRVLAGLMKRIDRKATVLNVENAASLSAAVAALK